MKYEKDSIIVVILFRKIYLWLSQFGLILFAKLDILVLGYLYELLFLNEVDSVFKHKEAVQYWLALNYKSIAKVSTFNEVPHDVVSSVSVLTYEGQNVINEKSRFRCWRRWDETWKVSFAYRDGGQLRQTFWSLAKLPLKVVGDIWLCFMA